MRIFIAEDDPTIARAIAVMLQKNKYAVEVAHTGTDALDAILAGSYDALILDIMLPGMDGLTVLRNVRAHGIHTPTLFLTARSEIEDRVAGLDAGADDYLPKPFAMSEFLARVRALLRRSESYTPRILTFGNVTLDCGQYTLSTVPSTETVRLNNKEFQLMELFMHHPRQVFPAERLMELVWGLDAAAEIDVVWTYIGFLRKKCRAVHADIAIQTIRGAGYALTEVDNHAS